MHFTRDTIAVTASTAARTFYSRVANGGLWSAVLSTGHTLKTTDVLAIKNEGTGESVLSKAVSTTKRFMPRIAVCNSTGGVIYHTTAGSKVSDLSEFANERAIVSLNASTGTGTLWLAWQGD